ncbi:MAG TPA: DUF1993 domain-containing protein [Caulobacteraceae bacterium]|jgi:hypothetical protein|nr:DUF1993 domain-containing protein [Caulobacteraceae bacterium]
MTLSMSQASASVFVLGLSGLKGVLAKARAHAQTKGFDAQALLQARLYPDMFPLTRQVQIAADFAKGCTARLSGAEPPTWEDKEATFEELEDRVERTIAFIKAIDPKTIDGSEGRDISLTRRGETTVVKGQTYLLDQALPNFWFHVTTAYAILRHNGVEVGKRDFLAMG